MSNVSDTCNNALHCVLCPLPNPKYTENIMYIFIYSQIPCQKLKKKIIKEN